MTTMGSVINANCGIHLRMYTLRESEKSGSFLLNFNLGNFPFPARRVLQGKRFLTYLELIKKNNRAYSGEVIRY